MSVLRRAAGNDQAGEEKNHGGGKQTVTAESVKDECLIGEKKEGDGEHRPDGDKQEAAELGVTKSSQSREAEDTEVSDGAEKSERRFVGS